MVYVFLADGFEEIEAIATIDLLRRAGIEVCTVSVSENACVNGAHGVTVKSDCLFAAKDFADAEMLVLPGGMPGTKNLDEHAGLCALLKQFNAEGKRLAAICAAPSILGRLGILDGKQATCYPGFEPLLGDSFVGGVVVESKNVITAKGPGVATDFALAIISELKGEAVATEVADAAIL